MTENNARWTRRQACAALALAVLAPAYAQDGASFTVQDFEWPDVSRGRVVPARLYLPTWPQTGASAARMPLVVFSHGIGGSRAGYSYLGRHFASQGVASLHLQHVGSDRNLWFGNPLSLVSRLHDAAQDSEAIARALDLKFALDRVLAGEAGQIIDSTHIVAAGHSYGANTTLLVAGAQVERKGRVLDFRDPRIAAAILISAPPFYGESDPAKVLAHVTVPTLHITATEDIIRIPGYYSGAEDRVAVFDATGSPSKTLAVFNGGSHSVFTDRGNTGGTELNPQIKVATKELSLAFVRSVVNGDTALMKAWPQRHGGLIYRFASTAFN